MSGAYQIRPTFTKEHQAEPASLAESLLHTFAGDDSDAHVQRVGQHIVLTPIPKARHLWSPWLHVEIEVAESGSLVRAKFSPHPNLWTSFAFGYFTLGTVVFFAGFFAVAQMFTGERPWAWWVTAVAAVGLIAMWITAKVGQGLAHEQMHQLRTQLEEALETAADTPSSQA